MFCRICNESTHSCRRCGAAGCGVKSYWNIIPIVRVHVRPQSRSALHILPQCNHFPNDLICRACNKSYQHLQLKTSTKRSTKVKLETNGLRVGTRTGAGITATLRYDKAFLVVGLGGLGVTCSPRDPRFAGSNPTEVVDFFRT